MVYNFLSIEPVGDDATLDMEVTPAIETMLKDFPFFLEIEMLQGKRQELKTGLIKYSVTISYPDKIELVKIFILKVIASSTNDLIEN